MKSSKSQTRARFHRIPSIVFERPCGMTSFAGLVVFQRLFEALDLKSRLQRCFRHEGAEPIFGTSRIVLLLVVHLLLGFRRLRALDVYREDPLVLRVLGLRQMPDVATVSRTLSGLNEKSLTNLQDANRMLVVERLVASNFDVVTVDFDGSVLSTKGRAEGSAVGFNKQKKGARSYYPLFCTVAQTGQILDRLHRSGNVHDSNGAVEFMKSCFALVRSRVPGARIESRIDSAFFSDEIIEMLRSEKVKFTCSVPFERFVELKQFIEARKTWQVLDDEWSFFEKRWKPKSWRESYRFIFLRRRTPMQHKGPLQLDLFQPRDFQFEYTVLVTNRNQPAGSTLLFHHGRGSQEKVFAEAKQHAGLDVIPGRRLACNKAFTLCSMLAHNLSRELQMRVCPEPTRELTHKRPARWRFSALGTLRQRIIHRPGRLTRPQGNLTLAIAAPADAQAEIERYLVALKPPGQVVQGGADSDAA